MVESAIATETAEVLDVDPERFQKRVEADAEVIKEELDAGTFDNHQGIVGLEYEFYAARAIDSGDRWRVEAGPPGSLRRVPRRLLSLTGFEKELGLHNVELSTSPQPLNAHGLAAQEEAVNAQLSSALSLTRIEGMRLVSDALWTIPPKGESAREYLTDSVEDEGIVIATNMADSPRYHAMANTGTPAGMRIDVPHASLQADTVMPESLITSIQPHYQVPHAEDLPSYFRYAIRIAGPLLALGVNSPFVPPGLYDDVAPTVVLEDAWMEHRIRIFETVLNASDIEKVRFPSDLATTAEAVDRIAADETFVPIPVEQEGRFDDEFAHFRTKHGTYWRWIRPVFGGATPGEANARIEFRPIPGQPTVRDSIAFQALFAGLIEGLHAEKHPVYDLDWAASRENFYAAMRDGLNAEFDWITTAGRSVTDPATMYEDLFDVAVDGLRARGLSHAEIWRYLGPVWERVRRGMTPARWKHRSVRAALEDGRDLDEAIELMQQRYVERQAETLLQGSFVDWLDD